LKDRNFLVFFLASFLICIPLAFYYQETNIYLNELHVAKAASKMSFGQMSETLFMFLMPWFFTRFGVKKMLAFGMAAWVLRYLLFGFGNAEAGLWMLMAGIILHGICYDFFFVTGQIYTDEKAGEKIRSSAQGMITLATYGFGMWAGFRIAGLIADNNAIRDAAGMVINHHWQNIWIFPGIFAAAVLLLFLIFFRYKKNNPGIPAKVNAG
jgi:MFS family permease